MKKIISLILINIILISGVFVLTGCNSKKETEEIKEQDIQEIDETLVKINGLEIHLNKEMSFKDIKYITAEEFKEVEHEKYIQYNYYQEDQTNLLFFRIFYYNNKGNDAAIKDLGLDSNITLTDGKTDNVEYKYYNSPRDDGGTMHFYFINKDGNTYTINFVSKYDIKDFEERVLKSIKF